MSKPLLQNRADVIMALALIATLLVYWIGLKGPFLLDDAPNFGVVRSWLSGNASLDDVLFGHGPWIDHRSVSMATFALTAKLGGYDPAAFKLGNLLLHLACGWLLFAFLERVLRRDASTAASARTIAALITSAWLLHPLHVSTVLYSVQRMTQLAAFFCLVGMLAYIWFREKARAGRDTRTAQFAFFLLFPAILFFAIQSKPNAAVLPLLLLVVELSYFNEDGGRPFAVRLFHLVFLAVPLTAFGIWLVLDPHPLLSRYAEYDFSASERLLTQARVLCDYLQQLLAPIPPCMGVFTDGYVISRGPLSPPSTAIAIAVLLIASALAWTYRRRAPTAAFGWFFFIAAHSIESFVAPVEVYYEHRNYLPSAGIFAAIATLLIAAGKLLASRGIRVGRIGILFASLLMLVLAFQTHGRARVWSDPLVLIRAELNAHPSSVRALVNYVGVAQTVGDIDRAYAVVNSAAETAGNARLQAHALLLRAWLDCYHRDSANESDVRKAIEMTNRLDLLTYFSLESLAVALEKGGCGGLSRQRFATLLAQVVDQARQQPDDLNLKWALRNRSAQFFADSKDWESALTQARLGWQTTTPGDGAAMLIEIFLMTGHAREALHVYQQALGKLGDSPQRKNLELVQPYIETELRSPGTYRRRNEPASGSTEEATE